MTIAGKDSFLNTPVEFLKGVGPGRASALKKELQISTFGDLLLFFPFRYVDRTRFYTISEISDDHTWVQIRGRLLEVQITGSLQSRRLRALLGDDSGTIELVWFKGLQWISDKLEKGQEWIVFGKPVLFKGKWNIPHPELEIPRTDPLPISETIRPIYSSTDTSKSKGLDSKGIARLVKTLLLHDHFYVPESLPEKLIEDLRLISRQDAFRQIHFPGDPAALQKAQSRLRFEELFFIQLRLIHQRHTRLTTREGFIFSRVGEHLNSFYHHHLTFPLTGAQKRVIREIRGDLGSGHQMNRLLQGDVGSGKTMVALMVMLIALDNGYQTCLMAPTEILARQHFSNISRMLQGMNVTVHLLTGSTSKTERGRIDHDLREGSVNILIGTHALIEEEVKFRNLGLVVIDEQHRFGVVQRAALWQKSSRTPHILVMTATPIPRTLAMTFYGDLETSVIDEMPPGRKPVVTRHARESNRLQVISFIRKKIREGTQVYIVYPLIKESETLDLKNLTEGFRAIRLEFPEPQYNVCMVHGRMKQQEKEAAMSSFLQGTSHIMVATTVIEVGVDVPNASLMIVENAERFGLAQLHQLRGRVGRGAAQSWCILMTSNELSADAMKRISAMVKTTDGFEIAEMDLRLRGPGDLQGTQQSGILNLKIADIVRDEKLLKFARNVASEIITEDPSLSLEKNRPLADHLNHIRDSGQNWGLIS